MTSIFHVIKDPIHGTMQFTSMEDAWVKPFIDSPNFQRLRHVKQLGLGDLIFPGAVHTRFNHCLGCCYVASQIAHKIGLADEERQLVMIASLMHDIGHGPFSHTFEGIFSGKAILHEDWTPYFLADYGKADFFNVYNRLNPRYHLNEEKFHAIAAMIMHRPQRKNVLADIVSSQLDADRLDYLLRDSHFCGVRYGEFDFRWLIHCMAIIEGNDSERLGITHKGIGAVEHYLMARRLMVRNIYHSQKKLALETFLVKLLENIAPDLDAHPSYEKLKHTRLGKFLIAVNEFNHELTSKNKETLKKSFLEKNYHLYKELLDYDVFALIKQLVDINESRDANQIANRLQLRRMPKIVRLDGMNLEKIQDELQTFKDKHKKQYQDWQLLFVQTPLQAYSGEEDPILVVNEAGKISPISDFSLMLNALSDKLEHVAFLSIDSALKDDKKINDFVKYLHTL